MLKEHALYKFGEFSLDPVAKVLFRSGEPLHMTRKAVETLLVLVEHPGQVLTKEEIMSAVWTDRVVDEANLAQNIAVIRRTLGAAKGSPAYIETFPGRGYRLEGPVIAEPVVAAEEALAAPTVVEPEVAGPRTAPPPAEPGSGFKRRYWAAAVIAVLLLAGTLWFAISLGRVRPSESFHVTAATRMTGKEFQPELSPDGTSLAFVWSEEGSSAPSLWVKTRDDASPRRLTETPGHYSSPAWSADGKSVAFLRIGRAATDVVVAEVTNGHERVVTRLSPPNYGYDNRLLDWSPDGRLLAVAHSEAMGKPLGLMLVDVQTGSTRRLTQPGPDVTSDLDPRFSPDGSRVSFVRMINRLQQEVFSIPTSGGEPGQMTRLGKRISSHDWMPDGKTVLVASDRGGEFRLWRISPQGSMSPVGIYGEFPIQFSVARTAGVLAYSVLHQDRNIWRFDLEQKTWKRVLASAGQDASPQYSPKGDRICFRSDRSGEEQLWVSTAEGRDPVQITRGNVKPSVGRWAPDGHAIVFNNPETGEVFVARENGSGWQTRGTGIRGVHPVFSPDGAWIYAGGPSAMIRIPAAGGSATEIAKTKAEALVASADGKYLYFVREPNDTTVWRLALTSGSIEQVLDGIVPACTSCWALSPEGVYYLGTAKQSFDQQVLAFHAFAGPERVVTEYPEALWPQGSGPFSLSPDGRYLLCVRVDPSNSDIMLVQPFE